MDFNSNPMLKKGMGKLTALLLGFLVLEIAAFVGVGMLIGGWNAVWLNVGFMLVGFVLKPTEPLSKQAPPTGLPQFSGRRIASTLFMIPGFLTDIIALVLLIPPVRRFLMGAVLKKVLPPGLGGMMGNGANPFAGMNMGANPFAGMNMGNAAPNAGATSEPPKTEAKKEAARDPFKKKKREKRNQPNDIIDIDYEVKNGPKSETKVEVERPSRDMPEGLRALEGHDVIDV